MLQRKTNGKASLRHMLRRADRVQGLIEGVCLCSGMQILEHSRRYIHVYGQDIL